MDGGFDGMRRETPTVVGVLGGVFVGAALLMAGRDALVVWRGEPTSARVVELAAAEQEGQVACPIFEVEAAGERVRAVSGHCPDPPKFAVGDTVDVHYHSADPGRVVLGGPDSLLKYLGLAAPGALLIAVALVLRLVSRRA